MQKLNKVSNLIKEAEILKLLVFGDSHKYIFASDLIGITSKEYSEIERRVISRFINYRNYRDNRYRVLELINVLLNQKPDYIDDSMEYLNDTN